MNKNTLHSIDQHQEILLLLPWYLNQTLELAERQQVENHLHSCIQCRRELINLRKLAATIKQASDLQVVADASFNSLREKLHTASPTRHPPVLSVVPQPVGRLDKHTDSNPSFSCNTLNRHKPFWAFLGTQETRLAIAASLLLAIIPFAMQYGRSPTTAGYHTLSDAKPEVSGGSRLRVVFSKSISDSNINALLVQIHGRRIDGPNSVGAYTVWLDSGKDAPQLATAIAFLRSQQEVMLAEPVLNQP